MDSNWPETVPARYLLMLIQHLEDKGFKAAKALTKAGLTLSALAHPHARVARDALTLVLQDLSRISGRTDLGFELGTLINIATADVVGRMLLSASTLAEGLTRTTPYFSLLTPSFREQYVQHTTHHVLRCTPSRPLPYDMAVMGMEALAVATHRVVLFLTQEKSVPCRLDVSWPAPAHAARYRFLKGVKVTFGVGDELGFELQIPSALAEAPLPMANPRELEQAEQACQRLLRDLATTRSWVQWVKLMLQSADGYFPNQHELSALMNVSSRTLARHLEAEGESYRVLSREVRHARAIDLLTTSARPVSDVAQTLGYSDAANFARAFRSMEGKSPASFRTLPGN